MSPRQEHMHNFNPSKSDRKQDRLIHCAAVDLARYCILEEFHLPQEQLKISEKWGVLKKTQATD